MANSPMGNLYFNALFSRAFILAIAWAACTPPRPFCFAPLAADAEADAADEIIAIERSKETGASAATSFDAVFCKKIASVCLDFPQNHPQQRLDHNQSGAKLPRRCGCSLVVKLHSSKVVSSVRFRPPAPINPNATATARSIAVTHKLAFLESHSV